MILDKYNVETYTAPVWDGNTVYHEDVLFFAGRKSARMLYPADKIVSVRSYDLQREYIYHKDFELQNGELVRVAGSSIPEYDIKPLTETAPSHVFKTVHEGMYLSEPDCVLMRQLTVAVTYEHSRMWEDGYRGAHPQSLADKLPVAFDKLNNGKELNVLIYGDSMSTGWGSSGSRSTDRIFDASNTGACMETCLFVPPYSPAWYDMMYSVLSKNYPNCKINIENLSLGGKSSCWGAKNIFARLALVKNKPDLLMIGFGINDACGGMEAEEYKQNTESIIKITEEHFGSELSVLLYSPHTCNADALCYPTDRFLCYEKMLYEIADMRRNTGVVPLSTVFADISRSKCALDRLENNINHCMDMGGRVYAQSMIAALS